MRPKFLMALAFGLVLIALLLLIVRSTTDPTEAPLPTSALADTDQPMESMAGQESQGRGLTESSLPPGLSGDALSVARAKAQAEVEAAIAASPDPDYARYYLGQISRDITFDWKQPINFYGKVVDETGVPLEGATASFHWTTLSDTGSATAVRTSDAHGLFELVGEQGKRLSVRVGKEGYYSAGISRLAVYEYASPFEGRFVPDPNNPVVFTLRQKGKAEPLVYGQNLFGVRIDVTPAYIDLYERRNRPTPSGDFHVQCVRTEPNAERLFDWSYTIAVPEGGLVECSEEFMFLAPEMGYQPSFTVTYKAGEPGWTDRREHRFFLRSRNGQHYARMVVTMLPRY